MSVVVDTATSYRCCMQCPSCGDDCLVTDIGVVTPRGRLRCLSCGWYEGCFADHFAAPKFVPDPRSLNWEEAAERKAFDAATVQSAASAPVFQQQ